MQEAEIVTIEFSNNYSLSLYGNVDLCVSIMIKMYVLFITFFLGTLYFSLFITETIRTLDLFPLLSINIHPIIFKCYDTFNFREVGKLELMEKDRLSVALAIY